MYFEIFEYKQNLKTYCFEYTSGYLVSHKLMMAYKT